MKNYSVIKDIFYGNCVWHDNLKIENEEKSVLDVIIPKALSLDF